MSKHRKKQDILRVPPPDDSQLDFFAPLILDIRLKDQREAMERPFLSFSSTNPQKTPIEYQSPDGSVWVKVIPHPDYGMALAIQSFPGSTRNAAGVLMNSLAR